MLPDGSVTSLPRVSFAALKRTTLDKSHGTNAGSMASARYVKANPVPDYGRIVTFRMTGGVSGWLRPPSGPMVVGVLARASTTAMPAVTCAKIT